LSARVFVTGVPGVGKTSICSHPDISRTELNVVDFGARMLVSGRQQGLIDSLDQLKALAPSSRLALQRSVVEQISTESQHQTIVLDGHLVVATPTGFVPGMPAECIDELRLSAIFIVQATTEEVLLRRKLNQPKYVSSPGVPTEMVSIHAELTRSAALSYCLTHAVPIQMVPNPQDQLHHAVATFLKLLRSFDS
jgi:adenylate kinase